MNRRIIAILMALTVAGCAAGEEALQNVQGMTADGYGCIDCHVADPDEYPAHEFTYPNAIFGSITTDLDNDGKAETLWVDTEQSSGEEIYSVAAEGNVFVRLNIQSGTDGTVYSTLTDFPVAPVHDHTGSWTDAKPADGPVYAATRVYLFGDAPYIVAESGDSALLYGDGAEYNIRIYRYTGEGLETVCTFRDAGSCPYVIYPDMMTDLGYLGIGDINFEDLWLRNGLIQSVTDYVPVAGIFTRAISNDRSGIDIDAVMDQYAETDERQMKVCEIHVLSAEELAEGQLSTCDRSGADGWFALDTDAYTSGTLVIDADTSVRLLPTVNSASIKDLKAGDVINYAGFGTEDPDTNEWMFCVLFDNRYGFVSENTAHIRETID